MYAKIQPVSVGWPVVSCDCLRVDAVFVNRIGFEGTADVRWTLYSSDGIGATGANTLKGAEYDAWGNDDAYLLTWLAEPAQLGLTIVEIVPDAPPAPPVADEPAPVVEEG